MRAVIQRVLKASVSVHGNIHSETKAGMMILLGVEVDDTDEDMEWLAGKIARLRIFDDEEGVMNKDIIEVSGEIMLVSQFTLLASTKKGNRPSYIKAARPELAVLMYEKMRNTLAKMTQRPVKTGVFGEEMQIELINNGPVTIIIDSKNRE
ncbi:MAG: D-tyrosyl-tRNA(Tyr) deacylase [Bacteroidales bacterium]|nr:D-tyrosyl-tRNA(Tyr) deacylase [Bacteroidales bacterium]